MGVLNMSGIFNWWWSRKVEGFNETCMANIIDLEFQMYTYHAKRKPNDKDDEILKTMIFFVGQQILRQDPFLYMLHVGCQPDHE